MPREKKTKKEKKAVYERPMMGGVVEREKASSPRDTTIPVRVPLRCRCADRGKL